LFFFLSFRLTLFYELSRTVSHLKQMWNVLVVFPHSLFRVILKICMILGSDLVKENMTNQQKYSKSTTSQWSNVHYVGFIFYFPQSKALRGISSIHIIFFQLTGSDWENMVSLFVLWTWHAPLSQLLHLFNSVCSLVFSVYSLLEASLGLLNCILETGDKTNVWEIVIQKKCLYKLNSIAFEISTLNNYRCITIYQRVPTQPNSMSRIYEIIQIILKWFLK